MTFQIKKLLLWPKKEGKAVRTVEFGLGKVNVITGDSRTGKSAIVPIIDYCLASSDCLIPRDVIRDSVAWYGLLVCLGDDGHTLFARKESDEGKPSDVFVVRENIAEDAIPASFDGTCERVNGDYVRNRLNAIAKIPYVSKESIAGQEVDHLSFRDISHMNLQAQEVMASQSVFFFKMNRGIYHSRLSEWFRFLIGAEPLWRISAMQELKTLKSVLKRKEAELQTMREVANERVVQLKGLVSTARELGFCCVDSEVPGDRAALVAIAQEVVEAGHKRDKATVKSLSEAERAYRQLLDEDNALGTEIAKLQKRLADLEEFKRDFSRMRNIASEREKHLGIIDWFNANSMAPGAKCPFCGSDTSHGEARAELTHLVDQMGRYAAQARISPELPRGYEMEVEATRREMRQKIEERQALRERYDVVRREDEEARNARSRIEEMFSLFGRLEAEIQYSRKINDPHGLMAEVDGLRADVSALERRICATNVEAETRRILTAIGELAQTRMRTLDCDEKYTGHPPMFDPKNMNVVLTDDHDRKMALTQVGSASNWVSCHIAFTCALQEYFSRLSADTSYLPSFMVYDQPSQVYFPKMQVSDDHVLVGTDQLNVTKMFRTIADSIKASGNRWQAIVLEHAAREIYQSLMDNGELCEVQEWRNGNKLIPKDWL